MIGCTITEGQVGMFVWARVPDEIEDTHELIDDLLQNAHVFITPGEIFGSNGRRFIRLSLCSDEETFETALQRIIEWQEAKLQLV